MKRKHESDDDDMMNFVIMLIIVFGVVGGAIFGRRIQDQLQPKNQFEPKIQLEEME